MRRGERFPNDQAEVVFSDRFIEQLSELPSADAEYVLAAIVSLCEDPAGKHPLHAPLAGWNTLEVLERNRRVVYKSSVVNSTGLVEVLCLGPRSDSEVYDMAEALVDSGYLTPEQITDLWDVLALLDVVAEDVGLDGWDYQPPTAPEGMVKAAVAAGVLEDAVARLLSKKELERAFEVWGENPNPEDLVSAILESVRTRAKLTASPFDILRERSSDRCGATMPRAQASCIRKAGHPGPHRAT